MGRSGNMGWRVLLHRSIAQDMRTTSNVSSVYRQNQVFVTQAMDVPDNEWRKIAEFDAQITKQILMNDLQTKKPISFLYTELQEHLAIKKRSCKDATTNRDSWLVASMNVLNDKEVVIQLISLTDHICTNKNNGFLSKILDNLEGDEYGFVLLNATTIKCSEEGMVLNNIHL
ncbi:hypothetical protein Tco_1087445 [Tanacetum coccineum]